MRGWKLPAKWHVVARKWHGIDGFARMVCVHDTLEEARELASQLLEQGWECADVVEKENLLPLFQEKKP